jgi:hypothetical protein
MPHPDLREPLTRILALSVDDVAVDGDRVWIHFGREPVELPDPLAHMTATLARNPAGRASTAIAAAPPPWLFQGMRVGQPLSHAHAAKRLKRLGVRTLGGRTGAILTLAAALPPTILAEMLGSPRRARAGGIASLAASGTATPRRRL